MATPLRNPRLQLMLVVSLLTAGLFYLWWVTRYTPKQGEIARALAHEADILSKNKQARAVIGGVGATNQLKAATLQYEHQAEHLSLLVPWDTSSTLPSLLPRVTGAAEDAGVHLQDIKQMPQGFSGSFATEGIIVTVTGRYNDVGRFISDVLTLDRITRVHTVKVSSFIMTPGTTAVPKSRSPQPQGTGAVSGSLLQGAIASTNAPAPDSSKTTLPVYGVQTSLEIVGYLLTTRQAPSPTDTTAAAKGAKAGAKPPSVPVVVKPAPKGSF